MSWNNNTWKWRAPLLPIEELQTLGEEIVARIDAGDKAKGRAADMYLSAGLHLLKAKERVGRNFRAFLKDHCNGLEKTRAYELMKIAKGDTTTEEVRAKTNARTQRHRAKAAEAKKATKTKTASSKVSATQRTLSQSEKAWSELKYSIDHWLPKMDATTKQKVLAYVTAKVR